jgi:hypothetical protein
MSEPERLWQRYLDRADAESRECEDLVWPSTVIRRALELACVDLHRARKLLAAVVLTDRSIPMPIEPEHVEAWHALMQRCAEESGVDEG